MPLTSAFDAFGLEGKRALVVGGSSGIGRAIAVGLIDHGARVAIAARATGKLNQVANAIGALPITADLSTSESALKLATDAVNGLGDVDILVLSSSVHETGLIMDHPDGVFEEVLASNVIGPAALARHLGLALSRNGGDVLVVNSTVVRAQNIKGRSYYAASKHAMRAFTDGLRDELSESGVRVTSIFPGVTATPLQERLHADHDKLYQPERLLQPEDVARAALVALSMPHTAEITEIFIRPRYKL